MSANPTETEQNPPAAIDTAGGTKTAAKVDINTGAETRSETRGETRDQAAERLLAQVNAVSTLRAACLGDPARRAAYMALREFQSARFAQTYADLLASPRHARAARFFLDDLYGPKDFSQRDADIARILPKMRRVLPPRALATLADAITLDALSETLDAALVAAHGAGVFSEASYARAYQACANAPEREAQVLLMRRIGNTLDSLTTTPFLFGTLKLMRGPARLAGLLGLQDFLERGFVAFRDMGGASEFLDTIERRERTLMARLFEGRENPFAGLSQTG